MFLYISISKVKQLNFLRFLILIVLLTKRNIPILTCPLRILLSLLLSSLPNHLLKLLWVLFIKLILELIILLLILFIIIILSTILSQSIKFLPHHLTTGEGFDLQNPGDSIRLKTTFILQSIINIFRDFLGLLEPNQTIY